MAGERLVKRGAQPYGVGPAGEMHLDVYGLRLAVIQTVPGDLIDDGEGEVGYGAAAALLPPTPEPTPRPSPEGGEGEGAGESSPRPSGGVRGPTDGATWPSAGVPRLSRDAPCPSGGSCRAGCSAVIGWCPPRCGRSVVRDRCRQAVRACYRPAVRD
ncbi:hypothetical protein Srufu_053990 [Streptomyces libani subsp. rufus]|nr:hypothetical protein Srufu_053990 [Streptomyces libani subsp. rufus]